MGLYLFSTWKVARHNVIWGDSVMALCKTLDGDADAD
jgi:hypothetical protein